MSTLPNSQPGAPPFNVINPSGVDAGQSIATIAQVGMQNRQGGGSPNSKDRKLDREQRERGMQQQVQLSQAEMAMQQKQFEATQKLEQEKMAWEQSQMEDEADYRMMSENLAQRGMELSTGLAQVNRDLADAIAMGDDAREAELEETKTTYEETIAKLNQQMHGAGLLKAAREGLFKADAQGQKGGSIGAQIISTLTNMAAGKVASVQDVIDNMDVLVGELNAKMTLGGEVDPRLFEQLAQVMGPKLATQQAKPQDVQAKLASLLNNAFAATKGITAKQAFAAPAPGERPVTIFGTSHSAQTEGAVAASDAQGMAKAREAMQKDYQELLGMGVDKDILGLVLRSMSRESTAAVPTVTGQESPTEVKAKGEVAKEIKPNQLKKMVSLMSASLNLSTGDFYNLKKGEAQNWVPDQIFKLMQTITNSDSPEALLDKLTSGQSSGFQKGTVEAKIALPDAGTPDDPSDDLHPEVRRVVIEQLQQAYSDLKSKKKELQLDEALPSNETELKGLLQEETSKYQRKTSDIKQRSRQSGSQSRKDAELEADAKRTEYMKKTSDERKAYNERRKARAQNAKKGRRSAEDDFVER